MAQRNYPLRKRVQPDQELLFIQIAKETVEEIPEVLGRSNLNGQAMHSGGRPVRFRLRPMVLALLLMNFLRMGYREIESYLAKNSAVRIQIGLRKAPSKSTLQRARARIGVGTLASLNDAVMGRFRKILYLRRYELHGDNVTVSGGRA